MGMWPRIDVVGVGVTAATCPHAYYLMRRAWVASSRHSEACSLSWCAIASASSLASVSESCVSVVIAVTASEDRESFSGHPSGLVGSIPLLRLLCAILLILLFTSSFTTSSAFDTPHPSDPLTLLVHTLH